MAFLGKFGQKMLLFAKWSLEKFLKETVLKLNNKIFKKLNNKKMNYKKLNHKKLKNKKKFRKNI